MGIFSGIGSVIDSIFGSGSSSDTDQIKAAIEADDKRDKTQSVLIYVSLGLGLTALLVAIFKKK